MSAVEGGGSAGREAGHTRGRWVAGRSDMATIVDGYDSKWIYAEDGQFPDRDTYVAVASGMDVEDWDEVMANAHLIAAAPDLLDAAYAGRHQLLAVLGLVRDTAHRTHVERAIKMLDDSIAKARP